MSTKTLKQIAELETLSIPQLEARWRKLFGADPPACEAAAAQRTEQQPPGRA